MKPLSRVLRIIFFVTGLLLTNGVLVAQIGYVAERGGFLSEIDLTNGQRTVLASIPGADGIVMEDADNLLITSFAANSDLVRYTISTGQVSVVASGFNRPQGIILDGQGNAIIAEQFANQVVSVNLSTGNITPLVQGLFAPTDVLLLSPNELLIAENGAGNILSYDISNNSLTTLASSPSLVGMVDLFEDSNGTLFVSVYNNGRIYTVGTGGTLTQFALVGFAHSIFEDPAGNLYVTSFNNNNISRIPPGGSPSVFSTGYANPVHHVFGAPPPPSIVPTLSQWGLILLGLGVVAMGSVVVWRRRSEMVIE